MATTHPAPYSTPIVAWLNHAITDERHRVLRAEDRDHITVLDPFGGIGGIHQLARQTVRTTAVEIEQEWANVARDSAPDSHAAGWARTIHADSVKWATVECGELFDVLATSVVYPNGIADGYVGAGKTRRNTYASHLGRLPSEGSSAGLGRWSSKSARTKHQEFLIGAFDAYAPLIQRGGLLLLNLKDPVWTENGERHIGPFTAWMWGMLTERHGAELVHMQSIGTRGLPDGANGKVRTGHEHILHMRMP